MRHIVIGTAGHIDHGKSTLVQALTGIDPDRLKEEKARGITIDLGFAHCQIGETRIAFVDVPGHERFVRNMLAGATGIDAVVLVVAADESVMPQTREHFAICRLLGVGAGVVALTKCDAADDELIAIARAEVRELIAGSFLEGAAIVEVSAKTGRGLDALRDALVQVAATQAPARARDAEGPMRLPIDRAFSMKGFGTVVTGTLVSGSVRVEDEIDLLPAGRRVRVRGLQVHGERVRDAHSGQRVAANLDGVETAEIQRGDLLATPDAFALTSTCDVTLDLLAEAKPLTHDTRVRVHHGTREALARISLVDPRMAPGSRAHARMRLEAPMIMTRGDRFVLRAYSPMVTIGGGSVLDPHPPRSALRTPTARARFTTLDPGPSASPLDPDPSLRAATLILEESGRTGLPITALSARLGLRGHAIDTIARSLVGASALAPSERSHESKVRAEQSAPRPRPPASAAAGAADPAAPAGRAGSSDDDARGAAIARAAASAGRVQGFDDHASAGAADPAASAGRVGLGAAVRVGDVLVSRRVFEGLGEALIEQVARHHEAQPDSEGVPREEVRDRLGVGPRVFEELGRGGGGGSLSRMRMRRRWRGLRRWCWRRG
jgi:selenocysteine-specific elongation factor